MKRFTKNLLRSISMTSVIAFALAFTPAVLAEKMELANDIIKIYGIGLQNKNDTSFNFENTKPDKVQITELSLTYEGKTKSQLSIVESGGDTLLSKEVKNGLIPSELQNSVRLYLSVGKNYEITHGNKKWRLNFVDEDQVMPEATDTVISSKDETLAIHQGEIDNNAKSYIPWWIYLIIAVLGLLCAYLMLPQIKHILLLQTKKMKSEHPEDRTSLANNESDCDIVNSNMTFEQKKDEQILDNIEIQREATELDECLKLIEGLIPEAYKGSTTKEKLIILEKKRSKWEEALNENQLVRKEFNLGDDENIKPLSEYLRRVIDDEKARIRTEERDKFASELIDKIRKNDKLKELYAKARENCSRSGKQTDIIINVINILPSKLQNNGISSISSNQSLDITESQINCKSNRSKLMRWSIEQIELKGYKGLNKNGLIDDVFQKIADALNQINNESIKRTDVEIIDEAIGSDSLTKEQKKVLIHKFIDKLNSILNVEYRIEDNLELEDFFQLIAGRIQQPNNFEEAQETIRRDNINSVNELLGSDIQKFDHESLVKAFRIAIVKLLNKHLANFNASNLEDAFQMLNINNDAQRSFESLLKKYNANTSSELVQAIKERVYNDVCKSSSAKLKELLPNQNIDSIQKLVNSLIRIVENAKEERAMIADALEERISMRDKDYTSTDEDKDILKLMDKYRVLVDKKEIELTTQIDNVKEENATLGNKISAQNKEINTLKSNNDNLMSETHSLVDNLYYGAEKILESCKTILNPCSDEEETQCMDIENSLFADLNSSVLRMKSFKVDKDTIPSDTRKLIQELLVKEISVENSAVNTVCRYFAYSRLPFMTDTAREYGITFNRKNMSELYNAVENLYVNFGISLNVPSLFVMGIQEGEFENVTGKMYGDLDNLCQNSRNHFDNIDSATKPSNVIVDIVNVGYSVEGQVRRITSVLTY